MKPGTLWLPVLLAVVCIGLVLFFQMRNVPELPTQPELPPLAPGEELMCEAQSREQAQSIADSYGIELVNYGYGIAVFTTEEDPRTVIERGKSQGLPILSLNYLTVLQ